MSKRLFGLWLAFLAAIVAEFPEAAPVIERLKENEALAMLLISGLTLAAHYVGVYLKNLKAKNG